MIINREHKPKPFRVGTSEHPLTNRDTYGILLTNWQITEGETSMNTEITKDILATGVRVPYPSLTSCSHLIHKAYKFRIYPNAEQSELLSKHFGCCRYVYNYFLAERNKAYRDSKKYLSYCDNANELVHVKKEPETEWLNEVYSHALQAALRNLDCSYKTFYRAIKEGKAEEIYKDGKPTGRRKYEPRYKSKRDYSQSITFPDNVRVSEGGLILPKFKTPIKMKQHRPLNGKVCHATVSRSATGKYYVSILCEEESPVLPDAKGAIGIDLGIKDMAVCSNGERIANPKFLEKAEKHTKYLNRQLSRKKKKGSNRRRARLRLSRHHEKVANRRKDFIHKFTIRAVRENQTVCVEDLNVKGMMSNHHLAKSICSVAFNEIVRQLEYKCKWYGRGFVKVGRWYASSKICHHCGRKYSELTLAERKWLCPQCGSVIDRDLNAAENILDEGLRILSGCGVQSDDKQKCGEAAA